MASARKTYYLGDNESPQLKFRDSLEDAVKEPSDLQSTIIDRSDFWKLVEDEDSSLDECKFFIVVPFQPRHIIYDITHPARSFHREIDTITKNDSLFVVIYQENEPDHGQRTCAATKRLIKTGKQQKFLSDLDKACRLISLKRVRGRSRMNMVQTEALKGFLGPGIRFKTEEEPEETSSEHEGEDQEKKNKEDHTDEQQPKDSGVELNIMTLEGLSTRVVSVLNGFFAWKEQLLEIDKGIETLKCIPLCPTMVASTENLKTRLFGEEVLRILQEMKAILTNFKSETSEILEKEMNEILKQREDLVESHCQQLQDKEKTNSQSNLAADGNSTPMPKEESKAGSEARPQSRNQPHDQTGQMACVVNTQQPSRIQNSPETAKDKKSECRLL